MEMEIGRIPVLDGKRELAVRVKDGIADVLLTMPGAKEGKAQLQVRNADVARQLGSFLIQAGFAIATEMTIDQGQPEHEASPAAPANPAAAPTGGTTP